jgi:hypothetical protein
MISQYLTVKQSMFFLRLKKGSMPLLKRDSPLQKPITGWAGHNYHKWPLVAALYISAARAFTLIKSPELIFG